MGLSENRLYPIVPNGFADHEIPSWKIASYFIGKIITQHFQLPTHMEYIDSIIGWYNLCVIYRLIEDYI